MQQPRRDSCWSIEQDEWRLLVDEHLHRRADAEELLRGADADTSVSVETRISPD